MVGNSDIDVVDDGSLQTARRPTGAAVMTGNGSVDTGEVGPELLVPDPDFAYGRRADPGAVVGAVERALDDADVVVVDPGDLDRADEQRRTFLPEHGGRVAQPGPRGHRRHPRPGRRRGSTTTRCSSSPASARRGVRGG